MKHGSRHSSELRERAVQMVREHGTEYPSRRAAIASVAVKLGCGAEALRGWVRQAERDVAQYADLTAYERRRLKELERENRELRRSNDLLRKATAFFAQAAIDRRSEEW